MTQSDARHHHQPEPAVDGARITTHPEHNHAAPAEPIPADHADHAHAGKDTRAHRRLARLGIVDRAGKRNLA